MIVVQKAAHPLPIFPGAEVIEDHRLGLSHSRNCAIAHATTDFILFADDDMTIDLDGLAQMREKLAGDPGLTLVAGWRREHLARSPKSAQAYPFTLWNSGRLCAPEMMLRLSDLRRMGVGFDPSFGVGAVTPVGEEYVFVADLLRKGGKGISLPVVAGSHPGQSTGDHWRDANLLQARLRVLHRVFGAFAPLVRILYALRHRHKLGAKAAVLFCLGRVSSGARSK